MTQTTLSEVLPQRPALLVLDFDGVLTDNFVYVDENGVESVRCSKEDSLGVALLREQGFPVVVLTSEKNPVVWRRTEKLQVPCVVGPLDKTSGFLELLARYGVVAADVVYVGNDVNDLGCLREAGCGLVVADAHPRAKAEADVVLSNPGGQGAVREVCEAILQRLGRDLPLVA